MAHSLPWSAMADMGILLGAMTSWTQLRQDLVPLAKLTWQEYQRHNGQWLAAALAYFTAFAIAPLIIIVLEIAVLVFGNNRQAVDLIFGYLQRDAGSGANAVRQIVTATFSEQHKGLVAEIISWVVLVGASIGLFNAVQFALDHIWDLTPVKMNIWTAVKQRITGFGALMAIAVLLLLSIVVNTILTAAGGYLTHVFPGFATLLKILDFAISFGVVWVAFAILFKYLPDTHVDWRDVWVGASLTAFLFVVGQFLLGWYLGRAAVSSGFGAFGSLVAFLIWVNYSSQIMLLGAEFTHVYAQRFGSKRYSTTTRGEVASGTVAASP
jgi:membrane protein